jgi:hypothetical protein
MADDQRFLFGQLLGHIDEVTTCFADADKKIVRQVDPIGGHDPPCAWSADELAAHRRDRGRTGYGFGPFFRCGPCGLLGSFGLRWETGPQRQALILVAWVDTPRTPSWVRRIAAECATCQSKWLSWHWPARGIVVRPAHPIRTWGRVSMTNETASRFCLGRHRVEKFGVQVTVEPRDPSAPSNFPAID